MRDLLRMGTGAALVVLIMFLGSLGLWIGTPLGMLWIGSKIQAATSSLGAAVGVMSIGVVCAILLLAVVLVRLSNAYRALRLSSGRQDPGHVVLEGVLVVSAGIAVVAFVIWFLLFAGATPVPLGISL
ncbi:MAG TPA: hypothetical protein VG295_01935 [Solirubrobacteraceae bacterium]|nr:hypothetical protein [Solirubrobacteraceae bacterium]